MPRVHRRERAQLVPRLLGARLPPVEAHALGDRADDPAVVARLAGRVERLAHALHAALGVRDGALGLAPRRARGEHDVGQLGGLGEQDVLHDHEIEAREQLARVLDVGLGLRRVLADHVQRAQLAALHALEHLRQVPAVARHDLAAPRRLEARARLGVALDVLEARQLVRDRAHVAAALHVVLAAQRVEPRAPAADVAAQQREVDQREHVVDAHVVLGDAERPADHRAVGARERVRGRADHVGRHARDPLALGERVRLDVRGVLREADRRAIDEAVVHEIGVDDLARHRVRERDVGADVEPQPAVGPLGRGGAPRIDRVELGAVVHALEQVVEEDRMRLTGIRSPQEDDVRLLDLAVGRGPAARTERCRQTDDTGSVSGAVT